MTFGPEVKDPNATVNYTIDWATNLPSESIGTSVWTASPSGLTVGTGTYSGLETTTTVSGGTAGCVYTLSNKVTTASAIIDERSITIRVENL
ncbi:hypothetical protein UFOVP1672_16 [uncultured Caudovirales phage]|uniref:Uncharacterized protein n=1 Tax=uncultured Caudovirales phage TaxID=2100421 RepID=A0A6J5Q4U3_9CAUD|nr:hypothetical protein UFOVP988_38 [uncultured Caudovirales phage]CAB4210756.1 hypothetical protein UFOVP1425_38 [uncultured Caudovirales phage]CAB4223309.1 hypothetical protein UFOVP1672_16 [uncultured Caudovirales phage]